MIEFVTKLLTSLNLNKCNGSQTVVQLSQLACGLSFQSEESLANVICKLNSVWCRPNNPEQPDKWNAKIYFNQSFLRDGNL